MGCSTVLPSTRYSLIPNLGCGACVSGSAAIVAADSMTGRSSIRRRKDIVVEGSGQPAVRQGSKESRWQMTAACQEDSPAPHKEQGGGTCVPPPCISMTPTGADPIAPVTA